ncbi:hypothetical protein GGF46_000784 [Coemansia sp. RSA 552]|nr:hypothetical protein GGF46_000784 [Coemansia sp. RSA 552]
MTAHGVSGTSSPAGGSRREEGAASSSGRQSVVGFSEAAAQDAQAQGSPAPFMTNPNYRIIMPAAGPTRDARHGAGSRGGAAQTALAASSLPPWISPTSQSKTYFPAQSPIISRDKEVLDTGEPVGVEGGDAMQVDSAPQELRTEYDVLPYEIHAWSNHSANFLPHNILIDRPHDQASRWSTNANNHRQFITLRLERPSLVPHVCNLKEFKVFGGMNEDNMVELLYSGLRNDSEAETISVRQQLHGHYIPCQYIKIQPLLAYDQKFNFSIWHVELRGTMDPQIVHRIASDFDRFKEQEAVRSCLRFFRDRSYTATFNTLSHQTKLHLEAPILTSIREALVQDRDYDRVEKLLYQAECSGMFSTCASKIPYASVWDEVEAAVHATPPARGGHQMCVDEDSRVAYLYGGWDGTNNLDDLWRLDMTTGKWLCISTSTRDQDGPGPRSCHTMCFDSVHKCIYVMGKYVDHEYRGTSGLENDLYCYDTLNNEWLVISENTEAMSGPKLLFNSQMAFDPRNDRIYVYGGKVVLPDASDSTIIYSGLYCFDLRKHRWTQLKPDFHMLEQEQHVRGRYFHSLLIDSGLQRLYIISSKRDVSVPSNIIVYDIATDTFFEKMADLNAATIARQPMTQERYLCEQQRLIPAQSAAPVRATRPQPDFGDHHPLHVHLLQDGRTVRATLDTARQEIYVLASVQNDVHSMSPDPLQTLMSALGSRGTGAGYYESGGAHTPYVGSLYTQAFGTGFHPCSNLMDSGLRYEAEHSPAAGGGSGASGRSGADKASQQSSRSAQNPGGGRRRHQPPQDHILMVVFCYHIPTETWTEVHNSARAAALFAAKAADSAGPDPDRGAFASNWRDNAGPGVSFPLPRFAQDWVFDRATHKHFMFGGNPNRPNDKSARFSDTWALAFTRPDSRDILRRALYLIRQRRFLDMCLGIELPPPLPPVASPVRPRGNLSAADGFSASAIPSPNSTLLSSPDLSGSSAAKRSPSPTSDNPSLRSQSHRQKKVFALDPNTSASTSKPSPTAIAAACTADPRDRTSQALAYLQHYVAPLVDHSNLNECQSFHALSTALFQMSDGQAAPGGPARNEPSPEALRKARAEVYEALLIYFPESQRQPPSCLDHIAAALFS